MPLKQTTHFMKSGVARLLGALAFFGFCGCSFLQPHADPTRFYVLTAPNISSERMAEGDCKQLKIGLKPVEMPAYLRGRLMVVRTGTNEIHFSEFERWAEPLDQGIARVMKQALGTSTNVASVTLNSHGDDRLDYEVEIRVVACEGVRGEKGNSSIRFTATWEVSGLGTNSTAITRGGFTAGTAVWDAKSFGQLAERLSQAIIAASQALAADLPMSVRTTTAITVKTKP